MTSCRSGIECLVMEKTFKIFCDDLISKSQMPCERGWYYTLASGGFQISTFCCMCAVHTELDRVHVV